MKIKLSPRDKNSIAAFLSALIALATLMTMLFPEFIDYKYSIMKLGSKADSIETMTYNLDNNERTIESLTGDIESKIEESNNVKDEAESLRARISQDNFNLHIPSFLITIEEASRSEGIDIDIDYSKLKINGELQAPADTTDNEDGDAVDNESEDFSDENTDFPEQETPEVPEESNPEGIPGEEGHIDDFEVDPMDPIDPMNENPMMSQPDMMIATIPVEIEGDFLNIREFIRVIDEIDFVEPSIITLKSDGNKIDGSVLLYIYYGEVL